MGPLAWRAHRGVSKGLLGWLDFLSMDGKERRLDFGKGKRDGTVKEGEKSLSSRKGGGVRKKPILLVVVGGRGGRF